MSTSAPTSEPSPTLEEVWASWDEEKRRWDARYPWNFFCKRPLSLYLTRWLLPLGVTANQATAFSALALAGSFIGFSLGYQAGFVVGGLLLVVFHVADMVDGNIARLRGGGSPAGDFFDNIAGTPKVIVYFFIGLGLYQTPDAWGHRLLAAATAEPDAALVGARLLMLGAWTAIASLLTMVLRTLVTLNLLQKAEPERLAADPGMLATSRGWRLRKFQGNLVNLQGHDFLPFFAALTGGMSFFLAASAVVQTINLILETFYYCRRALRLFPPSG
ncbi:MAG: CDP-alcohol phosphatidyltransferase family protein [bacterium]